MILQIPISDLLISRDWIVNQFESMSIDYADNALHATHRGDDKHKIVFSFEKYGVKLDNRWCRYEIYWGMAGVFIKLIESSPSQYSG